MTLKMNDSERTDEVLSIVASLLGTNSEVRLYGDSMQVSGEVDAAYMESLGFEYSERKGFWWRKF